MYREYIMSTVAPEFRRIKRRLFGIITRGFVTIVKDELKTQGLQVGVMHEETQDDIERFQNYGFSSVPLKEAEAILLALGGGRSHQVCIVVNDTEFRPTDMKEGDTVMYDNRNHMMKFTENGITIEKAPAPDTPEDKKQTIKIADDGITITSYPEKDVVINAKGNAWINATGEASNVTVDASGAVKITAGTDATVTAPSVNIDSSDVTCGGGNPVVTVDRLKTAINGAVPGVMDGGAAFKTSLAALITNATTGSSVLKTG